MWFRCRAVGPSCSAVSARLQLFLNFPQHLDREPAADLVAAGEKPVVEFVEMNTDAVAAADRGEFNRVVVEPAVDPAVLEPGDGNPHELGDLIVADARLDGKRLFAAPLLERG